MNTLGEHTGKPGARGPGFRAATLSLADLAQFTKKTDIIVYTIPSKLCFHFHLKDVKTGEGGAITQIQLSCALTPLPSAFSCSKPHTSIK